MQKQDGFVQHYGWVRTSVSLDTGTLAIMDALAAKWSVSMAEVMRRAIRIAKEHADHEERRMAPLDALNWLQEGGGLSVAEGEAFKNELRGERENP